jgi:hypothetical protein
MAGPTMVTEIIESSRVSLDSARQSGADCQLLVRGRARRVHEPNRATLYFTVPPEALIAYQVPPNCFAPT